MKKILLTGVAGFIGSKIARSLLNQGYSITGIDNLKTGNLTNIPEGVFFLLGDCADQTLFQKNDLLEENFDMIIHFAGQSSGEISFDDPVQDLRDNCISTLNLLNFARKISCKKFIFASSMSVYGKAQSHLVNESHPAAPLSMYAVGKLASENYLRIYQRYGISSISLRLFNVYGPGQNMSNMRQGMVSIYLAQALSEKKIIVKGSGERFRDFVYIDNVTQVIDRFIEKGFEGAAIYNVCTCVKTTVSNLLSSIKKALPYSNINIKFIGGTPGDQFGIVGDNAELLKAIGPLEFKDINDGIHNFVDSLKIYSD